MKLWPPSSSFLFSFSLPSSSRSYRILVAARSVATATMSSRPHYRGGRYRGYCDRSAVGEGENVAGNSHLNQGRGRGLNTGFRQVNGDNNGSSNVQFNPTPPQFQQNRPPQFQHNRRPYLQNQGYDGRPVHSNNNVQVDPKRLPNPNPMMGGSYGGHRQGVYVNKRTGQPNQFPPRNSKPRDFREWEYAKPEPPRHWGNF